MLLYTDRLDSEGLHFKDIVLLGAVRLVCSKVRLVVQARDIAFTVTHVEL